MRPGDRDLERLFLAGLTAAAAACGAATEPPHDGPSTGAGVATATATPTTSGTSTSRPVASSLPPDDTTPEGYARGYRAAGSFGAALSGLELQGFAKYEDGTFVCDGGKPCPASWDALATGEFDRAAIVKKRSTLVAITPVNFFEWVGPVEDPERAALRTKLEYGYEATTCAKLAELGYPCATGSDPSGVPVRKVEGGFEVATFGQRNVCEGSRWGMADSVGAVVVDREGNVREADNVLVAATDAKVRETVTCHYPMKGRRFDGYVDETPCDAESVLAYLLRSAREEAAAAIAFDALAVELADHGAPGELVRGARDAANDERRHAAAFLREAARHGGDGWARPPGVPARRDRPLLSLLLENAREGCANETYSAVVATHQALRAPTARQRALYRGIARDERRHAALSHRIHAWGRAVVAAADRAALDVARARAVAGFTSAGDVTAAGLSLGEPSRALARAAFSRVASALVGVPALGA